MKQKLTKTLVDKTEPTMGSDTWVWDTELEGFGLRVRPGGSKTYVLRYRTASGTQRKQTIAKANVMPPEKARELARKELAKVAAGEDPMAERAPKKDASKTLEAMFQAYVDNMKAKGRVSAGEVERALLLAENNAADALGRTEPPGSITPGKIVDYLATFYVAGHRGAADKHRSYIASAYTWAMKAAHDYTAAHRQDWGVSANPAATIARDQGALKTGDRHLVAHEIRKLWTATDGGGFDLQTAACIKILIGTGQRVQEVLRIDGSEIDLQAMLWRMPTHKTKTKKRPHTVPLPAVLAPVFALLKGVHGEGPLFPARAGGCSEIMPHQSINQAIGRWISDKKQVAHFTTRDLRRTWKSRAHDAGIDRFTRDLIQQHAKHDTGSKHYDLAEYLPQMTEAMVKWNTWLMASLAEPQVLQLKAA